MTKLEILNRYLLQWLFIRLARCEEKRITKFNMHSVSLTPEGMAAAGRVGAVKVMQWYGIMYWVVPTTGWNNDFKYIGEKKLWKITKEREVI